MPKLKPRDPNAPIQNRNGFLDALVAYLNLKNDAALSRALEVAPPVLSKIRHERLFVGPAFLLHAHDATGLTIAELRAMLYQPAPE